MKTNKEIAIEKYEAGEKPTYSSGICGSLTAGYGEVDENGYWEFPLPHSMLKEMESVLSFYKQNYLKA